MGLYYKHDFSRKFWRQTVGIPNWSIFYPPLSLVADLIVWGELYNCLSFVPPWFTCIILCHPYPLSRPLVFQVGFLCLPLDSLCLLAHRHSDIVRVTKANQGIVRISSTQFFPHIKSRNLILLSCFDDFLFLFCVSGVIATGHRHLIMVILLQVTKLNLNHLYLLSLFWQYRIAFSFVTDVSIHHRSTTQAAKHMEILMLWRPQPKKK